MIELGEATVTGTKIVLQPPGRMSGINACRLTNLTALALTIEGMGTAASVQYLAPMQQMVYELSDGGRQAPRIGGIDLGGGGAMPTLLVEWSNDGDNDFPGSYPVPVTLPAVAPYASIRDLVIGNPSGYYQTYIIDANPFRTGITIVNHSTSNTGVQWSDTDLADWTLAPTIPSGGTRTIATTGAIYLRVVPSSHDAETIEWWEGRFGPASGTSLGRRDPVSM